MSTQHLRHGEDQVGCGRSLGKPPAQFETDDFRREHVNRLAEHDRFGLNSADAPADNAEAVDHCRVAVRADQAVRIRDTVSRHDHSRQVLQVDLMHDTGRRRDNPEIVKGLLTPAEELIPLLVPLKFFVDVELQREV